MTEEQARVLARGGNIAVTQLSGRAFPGLHVQGDTFDALRTQIADAVSRLRHDPGDVDAMDDVDDAVAEMDQMLTFYESVLAERAVGLPYVRKAAG